MVTPQSRKLLSAGAAFEFPEHSGCHSDKEEFCSNLGEQEELIVSELTLKTLQQFEDFQAEYEGSIPFTRSDFLRYSMTFARFNTLLNAMLTRRPLNKPSRALVATGSLLECRFFRASRFQHSSTNNLLRYRT
jgi:hypothetical protein